MTWFLLGAVAVAAVWIAFGWWRCRRWPDALLGPDKFQVDHLFPGIALVLFALAVFAACEW